MYDFLIRMELNAVSTVLDRLPEKVAMLGSGPMPMTAIGIVDRARKLGQQISVLAVDVDASRIRKSSDLLHFIGGYDDVYHLVADVATGPESLHEFDAVYFAALIGSTAEEREDLLLSVAGRMRQGTVLITRAAAGLKTIVYPVCPSLLCPSSDLLLTCS